MSLSNFNQHTPDFAPAANTSEISKVSASRPGGSTPRYRRKILPIMYFSSVIAKFEPGQDREPEPNGIQFSFIASSASIQRSSRHSSGCRYWEANHDNITDTATWLTHEEKLLAARRLGVNGTATHVLSEPIGWAAIRETLTTKRLHVHYLTFFLAGPPFSSLSLFTPSITVGLGFWDLQAQLMTVPPYTNVCMTVAAVVTDRYNARGLVACVSALVSSSGIIASAAFSPTAFNALYGCLIIAASGAFSCVSPLIGWLAGNTFSPSVTGLAITLSISLAAPSQITGVWIYKAEEAKLGFQRVTGQMQAAF